MAFLEYLSEWQSVDGGQEDSEWLDPLMMQDIEEYTVSQDEPQQSDDRVQESGHE
jgi:hypothetical protein